MSAERKRINKTEQLHTTENARDERQMEQHEKHANERSVDLLLLSFIRFRLQTNKKTKDLIPMNTSQLERNIKRIGRPLSRTKFGVKKLFSKNVNLFC